MLGTARDGMLTWHDAITENPALGAVEAWDVYNTTPDTHPVHLHLVHFQIVHRQKIQGASGPRDRAFVGRPPHWQSAPPSAVRIRLEG